MRLELISGRSERVLNSSDRFDRLPSMLKRTLPQRNRSQACLADVEPEKERPVVEDHVPKTQTSARWLLGCLVRFGHRGFDPAPRDDRDGGRTAAPNRRSDGPRLPAGWTPRGTACSAWQCLGRTTRGVWSFRGFERAGSSERVGAGRGTWEFGWSWTNDRFGCTDEVSDHFGSMWLVRIHLCCLLAVVSLVALTSLTVAAVAQDLV